MPSIILLGSRGSTSKVRSLKRAPRQQLKLRRQRRGPIGVEKACHVPTEVPGPAEIKEAVALAQEPREAVFGISADISQAHRRVHVRKCDWGRLGCKSSSSSRVLWLNTVGTFGVSSAAYWWTNILSSMMASVYVRRAGGDRKHVRSWRPQQSVSIASASVRS